jgi:hypothetical protein
MTIKKYTPSQFINQLHFALSKPNTYIWGTYGQPITETLIRQKAAQYPDWFTQSRISDLRKLINTHFAFDCVGLIKGLVWGWNADLTHRRGGAIYGSNGLPDLTSTTLFNRSTDITTDFSTILPGEFVHMVGHIGVYIGNDQVIETTPLWENGIQITNLAQRRWLRHGKPSFIDFSTTEPEWKTIIRNTTNSPDSWFAFFDTIKNEDPIVQWIPELILRLHTNHYPPVDGKQLVELATNSTNEWLALIDKYSTHPLGQWLPQFFTKVAGH